MLIQCPRTLAAVIIYADCPEEVNEEMVKETQDVSCPVKEEMKKKPPPPLPKQPPPKQLVYNAIHNVMLHMTSAVMVRAVKRWNFSSVGKLSMDLVYLHAKKKKKKQLKPLQLKNNAELKETAVIQKQIIVVMT